MVEVRWLCLDGRPKSMHGVPEGSGRAVCGTTPGWRRGGCWLGVVASGVVEQVRGLPRCGRCVRVLAAARRVLGVVSG